MRTILQIVYQETFTWQLQTHLTSFFFHSWTDSTWFQYSTPSQCNLLMADLSAADAARDQSVTKATTAEQICAWCWWLKYLTSIGLHSDSFLDKFSRGQRHWILSGFAQATWSGCFSAERFATIKSRSVHAAMYHMASSFRANNRPYPRHDCNHKLAVILHCQFKGYTNHDPAKKPQKAITASILLWLHKLAITHVKKAMSELVMGAFFFAMCSCEYSSVTGKWHTKLLTLSNIRFFQHKRQLKHTDPNLSRANHVLITFEFQKREEQSDTITQEWSGHLQLCLSWLWASIVYRIWSYSGTNPDTHINTILRPDGKQSEIFAIDLLSNFALLSMRLASMNWASLPVR